MIAPGVQKRSLTDLSVKARHLADLPRTVGGFLPAGAIAENFPRKDINTSFSTSASGTLKLVKGPVLPGGRAVSSITFVSGTQAAVTPTNQWFVITDASRNVLATTVDDLTTAWAASTAKTLLLATTIGGSTPGGTYTPAADIEVYLGLCVVAATVPHTYGFTSVAATVGLAPILAGNSTTGRTTPASLSSPTTAITAGTGIPWGYVS